MLIVIGSCKHCQSNWRIPDSPDFSALTPEAIDLILGLLRIHCPTGTCHAREGTITVTDMDTDPPTIFSSPQDGTGQPIHSGDTVRYCGEEHRTDAVKVGRDEGGNSLLRLVGQDDPVIEWRVDLVSKN